MEAGCDHSCWQDFCIYIYMYILYTFSPTTITHLGGVSIHVYIQRKGNDFEDIKFKSFTIIVLVDDYINIHTWSFPNDHCSRTGL